MTPKSKLKLAGAVKAEIALLWGRG